MTHRIRLFSAVFFVFLFLNAVFGISAKEFVLPAFGYYVDLPDGWNVLDASRSDLVSFTDATRHGVFQIKRFESGTFPSVTEMSQYMKNALHADGDTAAFTYNGEPAVLADWRFTASKYPARGYFVFLKQEQHEVMLTAFTALQQYNGLHDFLISCIDSFSYDTSTKMRPGPISQFYKEFPGNKRQPTAISVVGTEKTLLVDPESMEASQVLIEREARVLAAYKENRNEAWKRYYRMIYRDTYPRLEPVFRLIEEEVEKKAPEGETLPEYLLEWIQSFEYSRLDSFSDLLSPLTSVIRSTGDCDARGLLYVILLRYFGIDSILLVSSEYKHSVAAVDTPGKGARFDYKGKGYLIAETTDDVAIGLIQQHMADPRGWVPVEFNHEIP